MSSSALSHGKTYMFQSVYNQQAIDLFGARYQHSKVWAHLFNGSKSQQWTATIIAENDPDSFLLSSVCNQSNCHRVLDQDLSNGRLFYNEFDGTPSQLWYTERISPGIVLIKNRANDAAITVQGPQEELLLLNPSYNYTTKDSKKQQWRLIEANWQVQVVDA